MIVVTKVGSSGRSYEFHGQDYPDTWQLKDTNTGTTWDTPEEMDTWHRKKNFAKKMKLAKAKKASQAKKV